MRNAWRHTLVAAGLAASLFPFAASARDAEAPWWQPGSFQLTAGGGKHVQSVSLGLAWDTGWRRSYTSGALTSYVEADIGAWRGSGHADGF